MDVSYKQIAFDSGIVKECDPSKGLMSGALAQDSSEYDFCADGQ